MPGKSRHGKRKRFHASKKSKHIMRQETGASSVVAPAVTAALKAAAPAPVTPARKPTASLSSVKTDQYAYVPGDLRRIGLLSVVIIIILFVLYFLLS